MSNDNTQQPPTNDSTVDTAGTPGFYQVFREHAHQYGIGRTWRIFYAEFNAGRLLLSEDTLFGYLSAYFNGHDRYDPAAAARQPWTLVSTTTTDLADEELFSLDGGGTWSVCHVLADGTRLHTIPSSNPASPLSPVAVLGNNERCLVVRPHRPAPSTAPTPGEQGAPAAFDPTHPCLAPQPGEVLVTYDYQQSFPALVEPAYVALPRFRADVAIQIARYVTGENARSTSPDVDDWLVIAPDQRSIVHLAPDIDNQGNWGFGLVAVNALFGDDGQPQRCLIGAGRWTWTYAPSHEPGDIQPNLARRAAIVARIKHEILRDVTTGVLPCMPATFAELKDYVDANTYGGLSDVHTDIDSDELITIQNEIETWLIQEAIRVIEARLGDQP